MSVVANFLGLMVSAAFTVVAYLDEQLSDRLILPTLAGALALYLLAKHWRRT